MDLFKYLAIVFAIFLINRYVVQAWKSKFIDLQCKVLDEEFVKVQRCDLSATGAKGAKEANVHLKLLQPPVTNLSATIQFLKKSNGYKPFTRNITVDGCEFMTMRKANPMVGYLFTFVEPYSNLNHTCPYDHDVIVVRAPPPNAHRIIYAPIPNGNYAFFNTFEANGKNRITIEAYMQLMEM